VERVDWNPSRNFFRPLDREAPRWVEKIFEQKRLNLRGGLEAIGVEVDERARWSAVHGVNVERRTCDILFDTKATREALHEGGFTDSEIAMQRECAGFWESSGKFGGDGL